MLLSILRERNIRNDVNFRGQDARTVKVQSWLKDLGAGFLAGGSKESFQPLLPRDHRGWSQREPFAADMLNSMKELAIYSGGVVELLAQNADGSFASINSKEVNDGFASLIALGKGSVLLVSEEEGIQILDASSLEVTQTFDVFSGAPRVALASESGRWFAVLSHRHELFVFDTETNSPIEVNLSSFDKASAIAFGNDDQLLVADRISRVRTWELQGSGITRAEDACEPDLTLMQTIYRSLIRPVNTILPKPSQLDNVIAWLTTEESDVALGDQFDQKSSLEQDRIQLDVWTPIWTNLGFVAFMLLVGSVLVVRRDY